jgi:hypothetical protein
MKRPLVGLIDLGLTPAIKRAVKALYNFLVSVPEDDDLSQETLGKHAHHLLACLLVCQHPVSKKVGGPLEYAFMLSMYLGHQTFQQASRLSKFCAMSQYCLRSILVHIVRLGGLDKCFVALDDEDWMMDDEQINDQRDKVDNLLFPPDLEFPVDLSEEGQEGLKTAIKMSDLMDQEEDDEDDDDSLQNDLWHSQTVLVGTEAFVNPMAISPEDDEQEQEDIFRDLKEDGLLR